MKLDLDIELVAFAVVLIAIVAAVGVAVLWLEARKLRKLSQGRR